MIANSNKEIWELKIHLIIGILCLPAYQYGGEVFKFVLAPYVLWMVFSMHPKFIPALLLHFMDGTTMSFIILMGFLIITVKNFNQIKKLGLNHLLLLTLIPIPLLVFAIYTRFFVKHESFVVIVGFLFMYLGLFCFFYFALLAQKFRLIHLQYIFVIMGFSVILQLFVPYSVRYIFFSIPIFATLLFLTVFKIKFFKNSLVLYSLLVLLISVFSGLTSTLIFTSFIGIFLSWKYVSNKKFKTDNVYILGIITFAIVALSILNYNPATQLSSDYNIESSQLNISDLGSIYDRAKFKLFEDRAPLWFSIFDKFIVNGTWLVPIESESYLFYTIEGTEIETDIPAHNIFLELIKIYGILTGALLSIVFISMIIKSSFLLKIKDLNLYLIVAVTCVVSCGFFGGMTGQYLLLGNFSLLFMGLAGFCYGIYTLKSANNLKIKNF